MMRQRSRLWPDADVLGVPVCRVTVSEFIEGLSQPQPQAQPQAQARGAGRLDIGHGQAAGNGPLFVTYLNAACSNIAADDGDYREILREADCVYADGQAIVWASGWLGDRLPERVNAGDFIVEFCRQAAGRGLRLALVGGRPGVAERAASRWKQEVPDLQVVATLDGFFNDGGATAAEAVADAGADLVLVGMGVPLQEKWAWAQRERLGARAVWCVGALFEYFGEGRPRAPVWVRRAGLEWLFRLVLEPRRLWRRYVIGNARFVWRCLAARSAREERRK